MLSFGILFQVTPDKQILVFYLSKIWNMKRVDILLYIFVSPIGSWKWKVCKLPLSQQAPISPTEISFFKYFTSHKQLSSNHHSAAFYWATGIIIAVTYVILNPAICHLKDGEAGLSDRPCCHGNVVLRWLTLMDGDDLEGGRREVEVCESGIL